MGDGPRPPYDAEASQPLTLTVRTNAAPEVAQPLPAQTVLAGTASEPLDLTPYFDDPDGDPLTYAAGVGERRGGDRRRSRATCSPSPVWRRAPRR